ncbi:hypothetical protein XFF6992_200016 [Xanthomonas citri pv. fuscans]|nr:hypothetical protein XFF6992_200016 [Xanthomonas citri pv. fuscans]SOO30830.1 hypothetical protein XFF6994_1170011 [Xanthomonas citri pv. fuscans]
MLHSDHGCGAWRLPITPWILKEDPSLAPDAICSATCAVHGGAKADGLALGNGKTSGHRKVRSQQVHTGSRSLPLDEAFEAGHADGCADSDDRHHDEQLNCGVPSRARIACCVHCAPP